MNKKTKLITKQLLLNNSYWVLNKDMVELLGLETAFLLSNFAEAESLMADKDGWFYQTSDTVEEMTTLSRHKQDQCIKQLDEMNILERDVRGIPPKRYFKINYECLTNQFVNFQQINMQEIDKSNCKKSTTNKERTYKQPTDKDKTEKPDPIPYQEIVNLFNEICTEAPRITKVTDKRKKQIALRYKELENLNVFEQAFRMVQESKFLTGDNDRGWVAKFDWLMANDTNIVKVLEGNYKNNKTKSSNPFKDVLREILENEQARDTLCNDDDQDSIPKLLP